jgi:hypothetical protein
LLLFVLVSCDTPTSAVIGELPTAAPTAVVATGASVQLPYVAVPATYTPGPDAPANGQGEPWVGVERLTPTPNPTLPTSTPVPPTATPTPAITATPTRYVSQIPYDLPPTDELGPSKLGVHVIQNNDPSIMAFVRQAQPAVMKGVGDFGFLAEVKEVSPRTITIGRFPASNQDMVGNPEDAARDFVNEQLPYYVANPFVDYWEGWNEPDPNVEFMWWYTRFEQERVRLMAQHGYRAAIGSFSMGVPEMDEMALFMPAIQTAIEHKGIMAIHEAAAPTLDYLYGDPLPGYPTYADRGPLAFRYRWYYRELLEPAGLVIPLVITELTVDGQLNPRPGPAALGWRELTGYWISQGLWGSDGVSAYVNQLAWYDAGVRQDGYVIGFCIFTAGGASSGWGTYDINEILPQLGAYAASQW